MTTVKDAYPLPRIDDTLDMLAGKKWFSLSHCHQTLDVRRLLPHTQDSSSLELCHLDSATHRPHSRDGPGSARIAVVLTLIFERLRSYGLQLKSTKCHLFRTSVPFLGHVIGRRGLECDPKKIEDVKALPVPDCLKSV